MHYQEEQQEYKMWGNYIQSQNRGKLVTHSSHEYKRCSSAGHCSSL